MQYQDFITQFNRQVFQLSNSDQLDLAIAVCKRIFFDYQHFTKANNWGNSDTLLDAIAFCEHAKVNDVDKPSVEAKLVIINSVTPDIDDFGDETSTYALNACIAVYETLQFLIDPQPKRSIPPVNYHWQKLFRSLPVMRQQQMYLVDWMCSDALQNIFHPFCGIYSMQFARTE